MDCSKETCKGYDELWCKGLVVGEKSCFEPVNPVPEVLETTTGGAVAGPEVFQGGELHNPIETPESRIRERKQLFDRIMQIVVEARTKSQNAFDEAFDRILKEASK